MIDVDKNTPEQRAAERLKQFTGLMWHAVVFLLVNGLLWTIDLIADDGRLWAFWVTIGWGVGLVFHAAAYWLDVNGRQSRRYQRYLEEEKQRQSP